MFFRIFGVTLAFSTITYASMDNELIQAYNSTISQLKDNSVVPLTYNDTFNKFIQRIETDRDHVLDRTIIREESEQKALLHHLSSGIEVDFSVSEFLEDSSYFKEINTFEIFIMSMAFYKRLSIHFSKKPCFSIRDIYMIKLFDYNSLSKISRLSFLFDCIPSLFFEDNLNISSSSALLENLKGYETPKKIKILDLFFTGKKYRQETAIALFRSLSFLNLRQIKNAPHFVEPLLQDTISNCDQSKFVKEMVGCLAHYSAEHIKTLWSALDAFFPTIEEKQKALKGFLFSSISPEKMNLLAASSHHLLERTNLKYGNEDEDEYEDEFRYSLESISNLTDCFERTTLAKTKLITKNAQDIVKKDGHKQIKKLVQLDYWEIEKYLGIIPRYVAHRP